MKEKDIAEKILLSYNDVFADVINGTVFEGREVIKSEELSDATPVNQFKDDGNVHHEQIRDIAKFWKKDKVIFSFIGIENQTKPDKDMILRVISYDGATYKSQMGNEHIYPVFTIVIYWGKSEWKAPIGLMERLDCPPELVGEISDYRFRLIDMTRLSDEEINKYKSDFRLIAGFIAEQENYSTGTEEIKHLEAFLDLLSMVSGDERFKTIKAEINGFKNERRTVNMSELWDKIENRGIEKGIEKGIEEGIERGLEMGRLKGEELATFNIARKLKNSKADIEFIVDITGLSREEVESL